MSRGFVREEDQEETPFVPPRASLPAGVVNYVTPEGHRQLLMEREELESERRQLDIENDKERRHAMAVLDGKINLLNQRISSARIINPEDQPKDEVRFGATVRFTFLAEEHEQGEQGEQGEEQGEEQEFNIVGVDQAKIERRQISFLAPLARALVGKRVGEVTSVLMGGKQQQLKILEVFYS